MCAFRDFPIFEVPPIISGMDKATNFKLGRYIHRVIRTKALSNKSPLKGQSCQRGRIWHLYERQIWQIYSDGPCEQKPIKNLGENGAWGVQGLSKLLEYPLLSQEWIKLRTSN